jgi:riboflavin biosynthesis pyrimidine reductase
LSGRLFDELVVYIAPRCLVRRGAPLPPLQHLEEKMSLRFTDCRSVGDDLRITAVPA